MKFLNKSNASFIKKLQCNIFGHSIVHSASDGRIASSMQVCDRCGYVKEFWSNYYEGPSFSPAFITRKN